MAFVAFDPIPPLSYQVVEVPTATSLHLIADATDTSVDYVRSLNPELKRDVTPRGEKYRVRVPAGKANQVLAVLKRVPHDRYETARVISIAPGEDLQSVANRTGVSVATLQSANSGIDLKTTTKLVVPSSNVRLTSYHRPKANTEAPAGPSLTKIRARRGDKLATIADRYKVSIDELARLNGIAPDAELQSGQEVKLPGAPSAPARSRRR
jgi:membrane-bound lytic murein transglycosylase D